MAPNATRLIVIGFVAVTLAAGIFFFRGSFRPPEGMGGREENVAPDAAGGRTQAMPDDSIHAGLSAGDIPVSEPVDPLVRGIAESPDIPRTAVHRGIKLIGERIRDAVVADGTIGDEEVPGVTFPSSMTQAQRTWFVDEAMGVMCGCGCGQDLLECRRDDLTCPTSPGIRDSLLAVAAKR